MLSDYEVIPTLATSDIKRARHFYEQVLGLVAHTVENEGVIYNTGTGRFMVYPSAFAGSNKATAMAFQVPHAAFDAEVADLLAHQGLQVGQVGVSVALLRHAIQSVRACHCARSRSTRLGATSHSVRPRAARCT